MTLFLNDAFLSLAQAGGGAAPGGFNPIIFMVMAVLALFYFMVLRPNNQDKRKQEEQLKSLAKGDQVVTIGGIHGTVEGVDITKGTVTLNVAPKVVMKFNKTAVASVTKSKGAKDAKEEDAKGE